MRAGFLATVCIAAFTAGVWAQTAEPGGSRSTAVAGMSREAARGLLDRYCVRCHNQRAAVGRDTGVMWDTVDLARVADHAEVLERGVRRLRAGLMPPSGSPRPDPGGLRRADRVARGRA